VDTLTKAQKEHLAVTRELGTAQEALRRSDAAQSKALAAVDKAQKTETEMRLKAQAAQERVNTRLVKMDKSNREQIELGSLEIEQVSIMGGLGHVRINRSTKNYTAVVELTRNGDSVAVYNSGSLTAEVRVSASLIVNGFLTNSTGGVTEGTIYVNPGEIKHMFRDKKFQGNLHNILVSTRFMPYQMDNT